MFPSYIHMSWWITNILQVKKAATTLKLASNWHIWQRTLSFKRFWWMPTCDLIAGMICAFTCFPQFVSASWRKFSQSDHVTGEWANPKENVQLTQRVPYLTSSRLTFISIISRLPAKAFQCSGCMCEIAWTLLSDALFSSILTSKFEGRQTKCLNIIVSLCFRPFCATQTALSWLDDSELRHGRGQPVLDSQSSAQPFERKKSRA